jgi:hypothetical protein
MSSKSSSSNISKPAKSIFLKRPHRPIQQLESLSGGKDLSGNAITINRITWDGQISIYCKPISELNQSIIRFQPFLSQYGSITRPHQRVQLSILYLPANQFDL